MDPHAEAFLRLLLRLFAAAARVNGFARSRRGAATPSAAQARVHRRSAMVRTKVIDDAVSEAAARVQQCVLPGAGTTPSRTGRPPWRMPVLEVDHPATQAAKQATISRLGLAHSSTRKCRTASSCQPREHPS